jgi:hypothetical protein
VRASTSNASGTPRICNPDGNPLLHAIVRQEQGIRPGGLGLVITRSLVDELIFNESRNEVSSSSTWISH